MSGEVLSAALDAHYVQRGRKSVGIARTRRKDDSRQHILHRLASGGVEDVRVDFGAYLKEFLVIA